ncbi:glycosyl hydrolase [Paenibacillus mendelii]|uniref:Glycosyl hydrolase n=1 Tax=Paenibacillus mendelii TaxID=206163 RepID=A0ABV6JM87_9BACL|nr:glycosyl hydrolase [Paenibacillus mendelii]MCQ6562321.1 glycosyl hydrolase [Paenibacillus mendelii]
MKDVGMPVAAGLLEQFKQPSTAYRSLPFWSWNDRMSADEIKAQIQEMSKQGMGGFFMHSREGLETEYMGEEWMACIQAAVAEAKAAGMKAWLYDEDRFPSGGAGGSVPRLGGDAYRSKALTMEVTAGHKQEVTSGIIAIFAASVEGDVLHHCRQVEQTDPDLLLDGEVWLVLRREISGPCEWFNDESPVDNLNPDAVAAFIEGTHEPYKAVIGDEFGKTVPGIFTDEPSIADFHSVYTRPWLPWTDEFASYFQERRGYELEPLLPYLFFHGEHSAKTRHDYWRTITDRFCAAYSQQLGQWCEDNEIAYTGHYLIEHNLGIGTRVSGAIMPHYRYQQVPGIDLLGEQADEYITVKQCTSVANQYRRPVVLSEMYGCCGWDFTFEGQKWVGDWQFALGVNVRCQHLSLYSLKGCRKRDFPPVFNYNTSWWKYNHVTEDYFARISAVMTEGIAVRDVLVIHPSSTLWTMIGCDPYVYKGWEDPNLLRANRYEEGFDKLIRTMLGFHYDFDFGDETIIEEKGHVTDGSFFVNYAGYRVVVLPRLHTLLGSTMKLLLAFMDAGGTVISVGQGITRIDGELSDEVYTLYSHEGMRIVGNEAELCSMLESVLPRQVSIRRRTSGEAPEFLYYLKEMPDCYALFVVNNDRNAGQEVEIALARVGRLEQWDLLTGETKEMGAEIRKDGMSFIANFGPAGSRLYVIHKDSQPKAALSTFSYAQTHELRLCDAMLGPVSTFSRTMPNALLLDTCSYRLEEDDWSETMFVWEAQKHVRDLLGMRQVHYNGLPQRYKWIDEPHPANETRIALRYSFEVQAVPERDVFLVLEQAEQ